jgi:hypothetical protein
MKAYGCFDLIYFFTDTTQLASREARNDQGFMQFFGTDWSEWLFLACFVLYGNGYPWSFITDHEVIQLLNKPFSPAGSGWGTPTLSSQMVLNQPKRP